MKRAYSQLVTPPPGTITLIDLPLTSDATERVWNVSGRVTNPSPTFDPDKGFLVNYTSNQGSCEITLPMPAQYKTDFLDANHIVATMTLYPTQRPSGWFYPFSFFSPQNASSGSGFNPNWSFNIINTSLILNAFQEARMEIVKNSSGSLDWVLTVNSWSNSGTTKINSSWYPTIRMFFRQWGAQGNYRGYIKDVLITVE